jgi:hypothetical protein
VAVPQRPLPRSVSALILLDNRSAELPLRHFVDVIAEKDGKRFLVSLKRQQVSGTTEQKVPFEVISLADAVTKDGFTKAYLVLGGEGWTSRALCTEADLSHLVAADNFNPNPRTLCRVRESRETLSSAARRRNEKGARGSAGA